MFGLSPALLGGTAIAFLLAVGGAGYRGYTWGYDSAEQTYQVKIDKMVIDNKEAVEKVRQALLTQADAAVATLETQNGKTRVVYRTITEMVDKIVDRPIYRDRCLDDDGLRLANAALGGVAAAPPAPSNANPGMPQPLPSLGRLRSGGAP